jgi:hypothetical protein
MKLHEIIENDKLNTIDPSLLTQETLTLRDVNGYTPFH